MIKRTICIESPAYIHLKLGQLIIDLNETNSTKSIPIEDLGVVVVENQQTTITQKCIIELSKNNVMVIWCDEKHMPFALTQPIFGNTTITESISKQVNCSLPLKKQLWKQTISVKLINQYTVLKELGIPAEKLKKWSQEVTLGDELNHESRGAAFYWRQLFGINFIRERDTDDTINSALNYGYAILRAITARALVSSGLIPTIGIFHKNKYNPYVLADDIMEPYRPFVDLAVKRWWDNNGIVNGVESPMKNLMLQVPVFDVVLEKKQQPLMLAMSRTTHSLKQCFSGELKKIRYPSIH